MRLTRMNNPYAFDDLIYGFWYLDIKKETVYLSPNASKLFGHNRSITLTYEEAINTSIHAEFVDKLQDQIGQVLRNRIEIMDTKIQVKTTLNEWRWVHLRGKAISRDANGSPNRLMGSVTDISQCKKAEEEIKKITETFKSIVDNLPVSMYVMDNKGRKILSNLTDCGNMGVNDESEIFGKTDLELFPGRIGEIGHNDTMNVINNITPIVNREEVFLDTDGNPKWLLTSKMPLFNQENKILGLLGIGIDITEQKRLQQKITNSETFYRTLVNLSPDGVVVADLEGKLVFISERTYQNFKVPEGENHIGDSIFDWVAPDNLALIKDYFKKVLEAKGPSKSKELKFLNYDKSEFWGELSASSIRDYSGQTIGLMVVGHDITDHRKIVEDLLLAKNKAEEFNKLKTAFLQNISHEIRTPLNAIVGFSTLLDDMKLSWDQQKSYIEYIIKGSNHLLDILNDILEMSNIEAGIAKLNENEIDLNELVEDLFNRFKLESDKRNIQLKCSLGIPDENVRIISDRTKLAQILSNLICNSLKFTETGIIEFGYSVDDSTIQFFVSDTGKGIPHDAFPKIFDRFYQVEHAENRLNEGTGLGLAICKAYVEMLGGRIWLTSVVGEGTTFYFTIPFTSIDSSMI